MPAKQIQLPDSMHVFERGWLSSNNILFIDDDAAALVDSGYVTHAPQTLVLLQHTLQGRALETHAQLHPSAAALLAKIAARLAWSGRSTHRALRVARTIADLAGSAHIEAPHIAEAAQYRQALRGT